MIPNYVRLGRLERDCFAFLSGGRTSGAMMLTSC